jgi:predicted Fe-Mo cluster-binding NifX family protein
MKTVITSLGNTTESLLDKRFGRSHWFCIYDSETKETQFITNPNIDADGGAGTQTSEMLIEMGVSKAISGHFGPKAKSLLDKFKVQMIAIEEDDITIQELINKL